MAKHKHQQDRHDFERPVRMTARGPKRRKKKRNGDQPPDRGHGTQPRPSRTDVPGSSGNGASMSQPQRPFRDLATQALHQTKLSPLEEARARRKRAEEQQSVVPGSAFLSADEKLLLSSLAQALRENTDTLRQVHGLDPIDRSEKTVEDEAPSEEAAKPDTEGDESEAEAEVVESETEVEESEAETEEAEPEADAD